MQWVINLLGLYPARVEIQYWTQFRHTLNYNTFFLFLFHKKSVVPLDISISIIDLLASNSFVSIPGLGSFVQQYQPARLSADGATFHPPSQVVTFDTGRTFNDNALERYLAGTYHISEREAEEHVARFVSEAKQRLDSMQTVQFEGIGSLSRSDSGTIIFNPLPEDRMASDTFGLAPVAVDAGVKPMASSFKASPPTAPRRDESHIVPNGVAPRRGRFALVAALAASVVVVLAVLGVLVTLPNFLPFQTPNLGDKRSAPIDVAGDLVPEEALALDKPAADTVSLPNQPQSGSAEIELRTASSSRQALFYHEPTQQEDRMYYIIVGSFINIEYAQKLHNTLSSKGLSPEIIKSNGQYRVSMSKFSDRNRAIRELYRVRGDAAHDQAWLLGL